MGILGGPIGVLFSGSVGALIGSAIDSDDAATVLWVEGVYADAYAPSFNIASSSALPLRIHTIFC